ncbi:hypothetical protein C1645_814648 [Glomus cerebriforme]|uniref:Uncharacterized protein n=1 Tax=Glomus cerebriforme TaxID=658196 RepID=A0A397TFH7_9GLOM|nr:hypothetical protein C1645_814648 [Glomus cerebriforme]
MILFISSLLACIRKHRNTPTPRIPDILIAIYFYTPTILQTFLIMLKWPINFYFVKFCFFILLLSLTRNVSYFTEEEIPKDFLATSTTYIQYRIKKLINRNARTLKFYIVEAPKDLNGKYITFMVDRSYCYVKYKHNDKNEKSGPYYIRNIRDIKQLMLSIRWNEKHVEHPLEKVVSEQEGKFVRLSPSEMLELDVTLFTEDKKLLKFYIDKAEEFDGKTIKFTVDGNSCKVDYRKGFRGPYFIQNIRSINHKSKLILEINDNKNQEDNKKKVGNKEESEKIEIKEENEKIENKEENEKIENKEENEKIENKDNNKEKKVEKVEHLLKGISDKREGVLVPITLNNGIKLNMSIFAENKRTLKFYIDETDFEADIGQHIEFMVRNESWKEQYNSENHDGREEHDSEDDDHKEHDGETHDDCKKNGSEKHVCKTNGSCIEDYKKNNPRIVHYISNIDITDKDLVLYVRVNGDISKMGEYPLKNVFESQSGLFFRTPKLIEGIVLFITTVEYEESIDDENDEVNNHINNKISVIEDEKDDSIVSIPID